MKFTIIIPIYKVEKYLEKCINSILQQTYKDFELILIDDGSPDSSPQICDKYVKKDDRVYVFHIPNGGVTNARKTAVLHARGEYCVCIDGDDWVSDTYLHEFSKVIDKYSPDIICCGHKCVCGETIETVCLPYKYGYYSRQDMERDIFPNLIQGKKNNYFSPTVWAKAIKKDIYYTQQLNIKNELLIGEDTACIIPCVYYSNSAYLLESCNYYYRINDGSAMRSKKAYKWENPRLIAENIMKQIDFTKYDFEKQIYRRVVLELFLTAMSQFNRKEELFIDIKKDIKQHLSEEFYAEIIKQADFKGLLKKLKRKILLHKNVELLYLYYKILLLLKR